ncbi:hypothetical protein HPY08_08365 [Vibrio cholerae]|uniref:calcium-binding protein n=5 Tax=Vibrio cholerae TaxID=666 RepID=UPI0015814137|nr:calcium-binding protein [Vibrio cholerae]QKU78936.1 hypothetical protein HPY08_08365 [Vibrio cholerae]
MSNFTDLTHFLNISDVYIKEEHHRLNDAFSSIISLLESIIDQLEELLDEEPDDEKPDEDGDGIPDDEEQDSDNDGIPDDIDPDQDGDNDPNNHDDDSGSTGGEGGTQGDAVHEGSNNSDRQRRIDPLVLDLDGDGLDFLSLDNSQAKFDLTGNSFATHSSWLSGDDGFLAIDKNNDGSINNIDELFGREDITGFEELELLDSNGDGKISTEDAAFEQLLIWQDKNGDGSSTQEELKKLSDYNITEIGLDRSASGAEKNDVLLEEVGHYVTVDANGNRQEYLLGDVLFSTRPTYSEFVGEVTLTDAAKAIANIQGYGMMPDLNAAMSLNKEFEAQILQFTRDLSSQTLTSGFDDILYGWAGSKGLTLADIDSTPNLSADENGLVRFPNANITLSIEQLGVLKAYTGINTLEIGDGIWNANGQTHTTGQLYLEAWNSIRANLVTKFAVSQGLLDHLIPSVTYDAASDTLQSTFDFKSRADATFQKVTSKLGNLKTANDAAELLLVLDVFEQFESGFSKTQKECVIDLIKSAEPAAYDWLANNIDLVKKIDNSILLGTNTQGGSAADFAIGSKGNDIINTGGGNDIVEGGLGNDTLHGGDGNDRVSGGEGDDSLTVSYSGSNTLDGGAGDDVLTVETPRDSGRYNVSYQTANNANNTLIGGTGNDRLVGGIGAERYEFNRGDGHDTIRDRDVYGTSIDQIILGEGIAREELSLRRDGNHMVLLIGGPDSGDSITIEEGYVNSEYQIEEIVLSDGSTVSPQLLPVLSSTEADTLRGGYFTDVLDGREGDDILYGEGGDDTLDGGQGDDVLDGGAGNDRLNAGDGNDTVMAGAGNDVVEGGLGNDTLHGGDGNDRVSGGEGDDSLTVSYSGSNTLDGGAGDDVLTVETPRDSGRYNVSYQTANNANNTLIGGTGNDRLVGGIGAERYEFNRGDGHDTIRDRDVYGTSIDQIILGEGIAREELSLRRDGNHMVLLIGGPDSGDSITIEEGYVNSEYQIEEIVLSDGSTVSPQLLPVLSSTEADTLRGGYFTDVLDGREGDDILYGEGGDDTLDGGQGDDVLDGGAGNDRLNAGDGNDTVMAGAGNDVVEGGLGNDTLHGGDGNDRVSGGEGDDSLTVSYSGSNTLDGGAGDDVLTVETPRDSGRYNVSYQTANNANNTLIGGTGNDRLVGGIGAERYEFNRGDGHDTIRDRDVYGTSIDQIILGEGIAREELSLRRDGNHMVLLIGGPDSGDSITIEEGYVNSEYQIEEIVLSDGSTVSPQLLPVLSSTEADTLRGGYFTDVLDGREGDDILYGEGGDDTLDGGQGDDVLDGGAGNDRLNAGDGNDTVMAGAGNDVVEGGLGNDTLHGGDGNDRVSGGEGDDSLTVSYSGSNTLDGGAGDDVLTVETPRDSGRYNVSYQTANNANNTLIGGTGNDRLVGGIGAERYEFNRGDGHDTIRDRDVYGTSIDQIILGEGIAREELSLRRDGNHMVLLIGGPDSGDSITIEEGYVNSEYQIEEIVLSDGSTVSPQLLPVLSSTEADTLRGGYFTDVLDGREGDDILYGEGGDDTLDGGQGDDVLDGGAGNDRLNAGDGNDTVMAGAGNDMVEGGLGNDTLHGGDGNDRVSGGEGDDSLTVSYSGSNTLDGGAGDDVLTVETPRDSGRYNVSYQTANNANNTLIGGTGNDRLVGGIGAERYEFNRGDGHDTIRDRDVYGTSIDQIILGEGIAREELSLRRDGNHMVLLIGGPDSGDSITIEEGYVNSEYQIEEIVLSDGSTVSPQLLPVLSSTEADTLRGGYFTDVLDGREGDDILYGEGGDDTLDGGQGDDVLDGGAGNDRLNAGDGNDTVMAGAGNDVVEGGLGNDTLHGGDGNDRVSGGEGDDSLTVSYSGSNTLDGGAGDDVLTVETPRDSGRYNVSYQTANNANNTLIGGTGNDRLVGGIGAERYEFNRGDGHDTIRDRDVYGTSIDQIILGEGIAREELSLRRDGNHMVLLIGGPDSGDSITIEEGYVNSEYQIEEIVLSDGSTVSPQLLPVLSSTEADTLRGGYFTDVLDGREGDDILYGEGGDDTLDGGQGDDVLDGGAGNDRLNAGDGNDTVMAGAGNDVVEGGLGNDTLHGGDGNDRVSGGEGDDSLTVSYSGSNTLDGGAGDDVLTVETPRDSGRYNVSYQTANNANNTLIGGTGNDRLVGGIGAERYEFNRGDGHDTIRDRDVYGTSIDQIILGEGIAREELSLRRDGNHMVLLIGGPDSGDSITIEEGYVNSEYQIEEIVLSDGSTVSPQLLPVLSSTEADTLRGGYFTDVLDGREGDDILYGEGGDDTLDGGQGDDVLDGGAGNDRLNAGDGNDTVMAGAGNDMVEGGLGNDTLHGGDGNDRVSGGEGDDSLTVSHSGSNTLDGGAGDDVLTVETPRDSGRYNVSYQTANNANNTLIGGTGNDRLVGGIGAERYEFNRGDGHDTIRDRDVYGTSIDQIILGEGIAREELSLRRDGNHMVLLIGGPDSGDSITIEEGYVNSEYQIEEIVLSDGSTVSPQLLPVLSSTEADTLRGGYFTDVLDGREGDDILYGEGGDDTLDGGQGDDVLDGGAGNDRLNAGDGNDTVMAGAGNDMVEGGLGNDTLHGGDGNDRVSGGEGDDSLTVSYSGSNTLDGGAGDDVLTVETPRDSGRYNVSYQTANNANNTLIGGTGNDRLVGGIGAERYEFNRGDGHDTIRDRDVYGTSIDQIILGEGIAREELSLRRDGNHMVLLIGGPDSGDSITIEEGYVNSEYQIEEIVLSDGSTVSPQLLPVLSSTEADTLRGGYFTDVLDGREGDDILYGEGGDDTLDGGQGDDVLDGGAGNDRLNAGDGNDTVMAGAGNDVVEGGLGNDTLHGGDGNDRVSGGEGDDSLTVSYSGSNTLDGGAGDDVLTVETPRDSGRYNVSYQTANNANNTLIGGTGNDRLVGGIGAERYEFNRGDGHDTIRDRDVYGTSIDQIILGEGIAREELSLRRDGNHMVLLIGGPDSGDSITIEEGYVNSEYQIEEVVLGEGSKVSPFDLPDYVEPVINTDLLVQAMGAFDTRESVTNNAVIDSVTSSFSPSLVVSGQIQL